MLPCLVLCAVAFPHSASAAPETGQATSIQQDAGHTGALPNSVLPGPLTERWNHGFGRLVSHPLIADDTVVVLTRDSDEYGGTSLSAFDRMDGRPLWSRQSGGSYWRGALAYDAGRVFTVNGDGILRALSIRTGNTVWSMDTGDSSGESIPVVSNGVVYVAGGRGPTAVDARTGTRLWDASGFQSSPAIDQKRVFTFSVCPTVYATNRSDGSTAWTYTSNCSGTDGAVPVVYDGRLYLGSLGGGYVYDTETGKLVDNFNGSYPPAFAHGIGLYASRDSVRAEDAATGRLLWSASPVDHSPYGDQIFEMAPIIVGHTAYLAEKSGVFRAFDLDTGAVKQKFVLDRSLDSWYAGPAIGLGAGEGSLGVPAGRFLRVLGPAGIDTRIDAAPDRFTSSRTASFTFASTDDAAAFDCRQDEGSWSPCEGVQQLTGIGDGDHSFEVRAHDGGDQDPVPAARRWTVDTTAPGTTLESGPGSLTRVKTATFRFRSDDDTAGFECRLDGGDFTPCATGKTYAGLGEGRHELSVRAIDLAGNRDESPESMAWTVDTVRPDTAFTFGPPTYGWEPDATFRFRASEANVSFKCRLDEAVAEDCASPVTYKNVADGSHTLYVQATDAAGNEEEVAASYSWSVRRDDAPQPRDRDHDGVRDENDNCPGTSNPDQADADRDGVGDVCDADDDDDGIADANDPCPFIAAPGGCPASPPSGGQGTSSGSGSGAFPVTSSGSGGSAPAPATSLPAVAGPDSRSLASLRSHLRRFGRRLSRAGAGRALARRDQLAERLTVTGAGVVRVRLVLPRRGPDLIVATGSHTFRRAGGAAVALRATAAGIRWLRHGGKGRLVLLAALTDGRGWSRTEQVGTALKR